MPEVRLAAAVLRDAIECFYKWSTNGHSPIYSEAVEWIANKDDTEFLSFPNCCSLLGIDSDGLRDQLRRWYRKREVVLRRHGEL